MEQLREEMLERGLNGYYEVLAPLAKQAVYMELEERECSVGVSKMGGSPDLPAGMQWPHMESGIPLSFIAQINFSEVHPFDYDGRLPEQGMLYFFYDCSDEGMPWGFDPKDADGWRVIFAEGAELKPAQEPEELEVSFSEARIPLRAGSTCPAMTATCATALSFPRRKRMNTTTGWRTGRGAATSSWATPTTSRAAWSWSASM